MAQFITNYIMVSLCTSWEKTMMDTLTRITIIGWMVLHGPFLSAEDPSTYHLTFDDEFDNGFDHIRWNTTDYHGIRNNPGDYQAQWFSDPRSAPAGYVAFNPFIHHPSGTLSIQAERTPKGAFSSGQPYVSGMMSTAHKFSQRYGYYELRAKLPAGSGLWSRFWLLTDDGAWPGEYDVFEVLGRDNSPDKNNYFSYQIRQTTHFWDRWTEHGVDGGQYRGINPFDGQFHTYGFLWLPESVTWYVDGVATLKQANRIDIPMYTILDLAVGNNGSWPGQVDSNTIFPAKMEMDYLRIYSNDPSLPGVTPDAGYSPSAHLPAGIVLDSKTSTPALPPGWAIGDVGKSDVPGATTWNPESGEWMQKGAGKAINVNGQCQFARVPLVGDGAVVASVRDVTEVVANEVRAGITLRTSDRMGCEEVSLYYRASIPWPQMELTTSLTLQYRERAGGSIVEEVVAPSLDSASEACPVTLKLARLGESLSAAYSLNGGTTWISVPIPRTLALSGTLLAGIATGGDGANEHKPVRATFSNVSVGRRIPVISTPSDLVVAGGSIRFSALLQDAIQGSEVKANRILWSVVSGGGKISTEGEYTAPASIGSGLATVKALVDGLPVTRTISLILPGNWMVPSLTQVPPGDIAFTDGRWMMSAGGRGISTAGGQDFFRFLASPARGDVTITARLEAAMDAQAGLMIRDYPTLDDRTVGAGSRYAGIWRTAKGIQWASREKAGGRAALVAEIPLSDGPVWLRLTRSGIESNTFTASYSMNGTQWNQIAHPLNLPISTTALAGLAVAGASEAPAERAIFSQVSISGARPGSPSVARQAHCLAGTAPGPVRIKGRKGVFAVLGADDGGEAALVYRWSAIGPGNVTFSDDKTNAAKSTTASFAASGIYTLIATIHDPDGNSAVSCLSVRVE